MTMFKIPNYSKLNNADHSKMSKIGPSNYIQFNARVKPKGTQNDNLGSNDYRNKMILEYTAFYLNITDLFYI